MTSGISKIAVAILVLVLCALPVSASNSSDSDPPADFRSKLSEWIEVHGFGGWAYAETDGNRYLLASPDGEAENVQFALNLTIAPRERLKLVAQVSFEDTLETLGEERSEVDYAFAEWTFSDKLKARIGRIKHPLGLYGESFNVGTIRPFYQLPQGIYGPQGITANGYDGLGLTGMLFRGDWRFKYDLYGGEFAGEIAAAGFFFGDPSQRLTSWVLSDFELNDVLGAKLDVFTPAPGWMFGFSVYGGTRRTQAASLVDDSDYEGLGIHFEHVGDSWEIRGERFALQQSENLDADSYYLEAAYRWSEHWQIGARYDLWEGDLKDPQRLIQFPGLRDVLRSEDAVLALNYWWSDQFVVRLEFHRIDGVRFTSPENPLDVLRFFNGGFFDAETEMILFGAQFSF